MKNVILFLVVILVFSACETQQNLFLLAKLDNREKADVLVKKGKALYELHLEKNENTKYISDIKEYFQNALAFDPKNRQAQYYLDKVTKYIKTNVNKKIKLSKNLLKKDKKRTKTEDYLLVAYVQKAFELDPGNSEVVSLKNQTSALSENLIINYLEDAEKILALAKKEKNISRKETYILRVMDLSSKALALNPQDGRAVRMNEEANQLLRESIDNSFNVVKQHIKENEYNAALMKIKELKNYNKKTKNRYMKEINNLQYDLYYNWAEYLFKYEKYELAASKIRIALNFSETQAAEALQDRIQTSISKTIVEKSFDKWVKEIDELIASGELAVAYKKIESIEKNIKDTNKSNTLKKRKKKIIAQFPKIYEQAVKDYIDENFEDAIEGFELIYEINSRYKDTREYLEEARMKLEILNKY